VVAGSAVFAFLAGALSILSPCVLPIVPIVFGAAMARHRWAPAALAAGIALSFTAAGLFVATIGFALGLDADWLRIVAAALLIGCALVLLVPPIEARFAVVAGRIGGTVDNAARGRSFDGVGGQFVLGVLLGVAWTPCVGPTLGAASILAAQGRALGQVAAVMVAYALGASLPLIALGVASRRLAARWRGALGGIGRRGRIALGAVAGLIGVAIVVGLDRPIETFLVNASPLWLTRLTTYF